MIDPYTQSIMHQERQDELMAQIGRKLTTQGQDFVGQSRGTIPVPHPWSSEIRHWLKEKLWDRGFAARQPIPAGKSH